MQAPYRTEAIVLRRTNYGEADRILSFITPGRGKISAIAKGVRRPKSKLAGGLELLAVCDLTLVAGRGDMALVTSARMSRFFGTILHEYERMELAYACIKEINKATETVAEPEFYYLLRDSLVYLDAPAISWSLVEVWFRLHVQAYLGHGLNLATDRAGDKLEAGVAYQFDFAENAFYKDGRGKFTGEHIKVLRLAAAKNPAVLAAVSGMEGLLEDCLWLLRTREA